LFVISFATAQTNYYHQTGCSYFPNNDTLEIGDYVAAETDENYKQIKKYWLSKFEDNNLILFKCRSNDSNNLVDPKNNKKLPSFYKQFIDELFDIMGFDSKFTYIYEYINLRNSNRGYFKFYFFWNGIRARNFSLHFDNREVAFYSYNIYEKSVFNCERNFYHPTKEIIITGKDTIVYNPTWAICKQFYNYLYVYTDVDIPIYDSIIYPFILKKHNINFDYDSVYIENRHLQPGSPKGTLNHEFVKDGKFNKDFYLQISSNSSISSSYMVEPRRSYIAHKIAKEPNPSPNIVKQSYNRLFLGYFEMRYSRDYFFNKKLEITDSIIENAKSFLKFDEQLYNLKPIPSSDPEVLNFQLFYKGYLAENSVWQIFNDDFYVQYSKIPFGP